MEEGHEMAGRAHARLPIDQLVALGREVRER
jgi:hypothetical protein